jgi:cell wall-associated NlpC family hydrolase
MRPLADYTAIPYVSKGRDPQTGVDCWGLLRLFYAEQFGIELPLHDDRYVHSDSRGETAELARDEIRERWLQVRTPQYGDAVVLALSRRPFHVGICIGGNRFLHALDPRVNTVIERLDAPVWARRLEGFYRHVDRA